MFKTINDWLNKEVASVEGILAGFYNTLKQLEQHAEDKLNEAIKWADEEFTAEEKKLAAQVEAAKASDIAKKITALLS